MDKKKGLLFSVCAFALILLEAIFKVKLRGGDESVKAMAKNTADYLFVCPMSSHTWDAVAKSFDRLQQYISMFIVFVVIVLLFSWGWALYQNLLKDKFVADAYKRPWEITKMFFWATIVFVMAVMSPNHFRAKITGRSNGHETKWVLCEQTSANARAIPLSKIKKIKLY